MTFLYITVLCSCFIMKSNYGNELSFHLAVNSAWTGRRPRWLIVAERTNSVSFILNKKRNATIGGRGFSSLRVKR